MICPECGFTSQEYAFFCLNCGYSINPATQGTDRGTPRKVNSKWVAAPSEPVPDAIYDEGTAFFHAENYPAALARFTKVLDINPSLDKAWNAKGVTYAKLGRYGDALRCYEKALQFSPDNPKYLANREKSILKGSGDTFKEVRPRYAINVKSLELPGMTKPDLLPHQAPVPVPYRANRVILLLFVVFWAVFLLSAGVFKEKWIGINVIFIGIALTGAVVTERDARAIGAGKNPEGVGFARWRPDSWRWFLFVIFPLSSGVYLAKRKNIFYSNRECRHLPLLARTTGQTVVQGLGLFSLLAIAVMVLATLVMAITGFYH